MTLTECIVGAHRRWGIRFTDKAKGTLEKCSVENCADSGIVISNNANCQVCDATVKGCDVGLRASHAIADIQQSTFTTNRIAISILHSDEAPVGEVEQPPTEKATPTTSCLVISHCLLDGNVIGVRSQESKPKLLNTTITNNSKAGLVLMKGSMLDAQECTVRENDIGIEIEEDARGAVTKTLIEKNRIGVNVPQEAFTVIGANTIQRNTTYGCRIQSNNSLVFDLNELSTNGQAGLFLGADANLTVRGNAFSSEQCGVQVIDGRAAPTISKNKFTNCTVGIRVSGSEACPTCSLNIFQNNDTGFIGENGAGGLLSQNVFRTNKLSGFTSDTGAKTTVENNLFELHEDSAYGVTIRPSGCGDVKGNKMLHNVSAVLMMGGSFATIRENAIQLNKHYGVVVQPEASGEISANTFAKNGRADVFVCGATTCNIRRNIFASSSVRVWCSTNATAKIEHNTFQGAGGMGILSDQGAKPVAFANHFARGVDVALCTGDGGAGEYVKNTIIGATIGILAKEGGAGLFRGNTVTSCASHAVSIEANASPVIRESVLAGGGVQHKSLVATRGGGEVVQNLICGGGVGVQLGENATTLISQNRVRDNRCGIHLAPKSRANTTANVVTNNETGVIATGESQGTLNENHVFSNIKVGLVYGSRVMEAEGNVIYGVNEDSALQTHEDVNLPKNNIVKNNMHLVGELDRLPNCVPSTVPKERELNAAASAKAGSRSTHKSESVIAISVVAISEAAIACEAEATGKRGREANRLRRNKLEAPCPRRNNRAAKGGFVCSFDHASRK